MKPAPLQTILDKLAALIVRTLAAEPHFYGSITLYFEDGKLRKAERKESLNLVE
jgi:hypothetical protein